MEERCTCKAEDIYGVGYCREQLKAIRCPDCSTTIHYDEMCWYCTLHPLLKLKMVDPTPTCECGGKFEKVCEWENICEGCSLVHQVECSCVTHRGKRSKYNIKYNLNKQLARFNLTEEQKRTVTMRVNEIERLWYTAHDRKLIKLDFILSNIFAHIGLSEKAKQCATIKNQKTLTTYEQIWGSIVDRIEGW